MAIRNIESPEGNFLSEVESTYAQPRVYYTTPDDIPRVYPGNTNYSKRRRTEMAALFTHDYKPTERREVEAPTVTFSEWTMFEALASPLDKLGFKVDVAPLDLEQGNDKSQDVPKRKGIDVVVLQRRPDGQLLTILGINAKLAIIKPKTYVEKQRYDPQLRAPSINLSVGDWVYDTEEDEEIRIRGWTENYAVPTIAATGALPDLGSIRKYLIERTVETLGSYQEKADGYMAGNYTPAEHEPLAFPEDPEDLSVFHQKLTVANILFTSLAQTYT